MTQTERPADTNDAFRPDSPEFGAMVAPVAAVVCDGCGKPFAKASDRPDAIRIECAACGYIDWIWKDTEYDDLD